MKDSENPESSESRTGKKGASPRNPWAAWDTKIKELEAENKKQKAQIKSDVGGEWGRRANIHGRPGGA